MAWNGLGGLHSRGIGVRLAGIGAGVGCGGCAVGVDRGRDLVGLGDGGGCRGAGMGGDICRGTGICGSTLERPVVCRGGIRHGTGGWVGMGVGYARDAKLADGQRFFPVVSGSAGDGWIHRGQPAHVDGQLRLRGMDGARLAVVLSLAPAGGADCFRMGRPNAPGHRGYGMRASYVADGPLVGWRASCTLDRDSVGRHAGFCHASSRPQPSSAGGMRISGGDVSLRGMDLRGWWHAEESRACPRNVHACRDCMLRRVGMATLPSECRDFAGS